MDLIVELIKADRSLDAYDLATALRGPDFHGKEYDFIKDICTKPIRDFVGLNVQPITGKKAYEALTQGDKYWFNDIWRGEGRDNIGHYRGHIYAGLHAVITAPSHLVSAERRQEAKDLWRFLRAIQLNVTESEVVGYQ